MEISERPTERLTSNEDNCLDYRKNIRNIFVANFFSVLLGVLTLGPLFDAYLLNIGGKHGNKLVGAMESTRGILQLVLSFPIGYLSDRMSRIRLLKWNVLSWTIGLSFLLLGIAGDSLPFMFVGMALWAPSSSCWISTTQVVVSESLIPSKRTEVLSRLTQLRLVATAAGPLLQLILLLVSGKNHWGTSLLRAVIVSGTILWPGSLWILKLKDLEPWEKSERQNQSRFAEEDLDRELFRVRVRWWLAVWIEVLSLITLFGAGMTVKFFPLFFRIDYGFTPLEVCLLTFVYPLSIVVMVWACKRASRHFGRLHAIVLFQFMGTSCLWALCYTRPLVIVVPLFLFRGALMNARGPIVRAVIMDLVPSDMRGRWNSVQSLSGFAWSGSAALGGYLADLSGDYRFTFVVTAGIYTTAFFLHLPLFFIYPREKEPGQQQARQAALPNLQESLSRSISMCSSTSEASGPSVCPRTS